MKRGHIPERTCKACGRKAPKQELDRFVMRQGQPVIEVNQQGTGYGIYCCRDTACGDRLIKKIVKRKKKVVFSAQKRKEDGSNQ